ncbi:chromosomal replication initiator protein DnaA [Candidatus Jorgensenbacteria bacterium CG10_big_fil_rev_8_21_14_0_10_54_38]|uniref:Chromosomal replication initiator protein DnaA n=1 Tax=Candidatus Jorgensenbacteria bacterium CG10_big_fil_rev_8_21_14_0_10_54_38 TaxID=1974593 RepID=A0A2M6WG12_9BACT|nr:MAG: chromosomal replication initiator protein DnaA [Candidatus Jorgensenbacteria bacterium CG10_big_fil_rev_8_21_14_0_10_54_38]
MGEYVYHKGTSYGKLSITITMELKDLWKTVLGEIELQISRPNFITWLKYSELLEKNDREGVVLVGLPNNFAKEWVKNRYHKLILGSLRGLDGSVKHVEYTVTSTRAVGMPSVVARPTNTAPLTDEKSQLPITELKVDPVTNLNPRYTLDTFVVGSSNELASAAVHAIIKDVGKKYNPLFIYGGVGLGKTHLIQATGNAIHAKYRGRVRVFYVTSEKFINDVVWAVRNRRMEDTKKRYRDVDVLIIDDIQFIGGKPTTELEFFYTFNALYEHNKQIIISSDRPAAAIPTLEERLRSRFEGGMTADISFPDYEMRLAILKAKVQERGVVLEDSILKQVAAKVQKNTRELEGVLNKIIFLQQYKGGGVDSKKVDEVINEMVCVSAKNVTANDVIKTVAEFFEIPQSELINRNRKREVVEPRQIAMFLLRDVLKLSYPHIGEKLGKRDHTTAIHAYEKISKELNQNQVLNQKIMLIKERVYKS